MRIHARSFNPVAWLFALTDKYLWRSTYASCSAVRDDGKFCNRLAGHWGRHRE